MTFLTSFLEQLNWATSLDLAVPGRGQRATQPQQCWPPAPRSRLSPGPCLILCFSPSLSIRSSDSEEAFETPESTTPVKAPPAPPPPPPEVTLEPEISAQPPLEEPGNQGQVLPRGSLGAALGWGSWLGGTHWSSLDTPQPLASFCSRLCSLYLSEQIQWIILFALMMFRAGLWGNHSFSPGTFHLASRIGFEGTSGSGRFLCGILSWVLIFGP